MTAYGQDLIAADKAAPDPDALLMLVSFADIRRPAVRVLGERLRRNRWSLYLIGARVAVRDNADGLVLLGESNAVLGSLRPDDPGSDRYMIDGPGLEGPLYALFRH